MGHARVCIQQYHLSPAAPAGVVEECRQFEYDYPRRRLGR